MAKLSLIIIALLIFETAAQCTIKKARKSFRRSIYEFSIDLMSRISQDTENHFAASPLSIWSLLTAASLGAENATLAELQKVLKHHPHRCFNMKYLEIIKKITESTQDIVLQHSSTLFADEKLSIKKKFRRKVDKTGVCNVKVYPFDDTSEISGIINEYVSNVTHGNIEEVITASDLEDAYLVLIDAFYFKGKWLYPFPVVRSAKSEFYNEKGNQIGDINLMHLAQSLNLTYVKRIKSKVLELPYGTHGRFSMLVFLPDNGISVSEVMDSMRTITLGSIFRLLSRFEDEIVSVHLPKFSISSDLDNFKELLTDMGLKTVFDSNLARFPYLSDYSLHVSNLVQKVKIEINEEGSEASAASEATFSSRSLPDEFNVNKPFLFMIVDKNIEVPLITGSFSNPALF